MAAIIGPDGKPVPAGGQLVTPKGQKVVQAHLKKLADLKALALEHGVSDGEAEAAFLKLKALQQKAKAHAAAKAQTEALKGLYTSPMYAGALPKTQKAKGIKVLQSAKMLSEAYARVATTEAEAIAAAHAVGLPCFARPCPITPRHGFVDSRPVNTEAEVRQVWSEARAADPGAELVLMPFINASHNMVWRPGLLSIGPGHDGATAGHESISIFLQPDYSQNWKNLATQAGCNLEQSDPFIEAVCSVGDELVLTQIRAGVKGAPTAPDWNPTAFTIGEVVSIDGDAKKVDGAMLAWETTAKGLQPGHHCVWNPGGNLGDHWSVHAQLNHIAVVTSFVPQVGQLLPKMGEELVPLEPQAIVWGFLGGLLSPDLLQPTMRRRAVAAALLGSHHGMRMGGDAGVFIGASVALMLRLGQAALWGEARHASESGLKGKARDQIYKSILNSWLKGREGLKDKVSLFWTHSWNGGYGGPPWAACGKATCELDASMLALVRVPSRMNAKKVLASLTNAVNLAHNNGWWLNKFNADQTLFDLAADLDPRIAIMAGPAWYESALVPADKRLALLAKVEQLHPIDLSAVEAQYGKKAGKALAPKGKAATADGLPKGLDIGSGVAGGGASPYVHKPSKKQGSFGAIAKGGTIRTESPVISAQMQGGHLQIVTGSGGEYLSGEVEGLSPALLAELSKKPTVPSLSGSGAVYNLVLVEGPLLKVGGYLLAKIKVKGSVESE